MFDESSGYIEPDITGGNYKYYFLYEVGNDLVFTSEPLNTLVQRIRLRFRSYFFQRMMQREEPTGETVSSIGPDMLKIFDDILSAADWPESDAVAETLPHNSALSQQISSPSLAQAHMQVDDDQSLHSHWPHGKRRQTCDDVGHENSLQGSRERPKRKKVKTDVLSPPQPKSTQARQARRPAQLGLDSMRRITRSQTKRSLRTKISTAK